MEYMIIPLEEKSWTETFKWKALMIEEERILLSSLKHASTDKFIQQLDKKSLFVKTREIPITSLIQVTQYETTIQLKWVDHVGKDRKDRFRFEERAIADSFTQLLEGRIGWKPYDNGHMAWRFLMGRGTFLALTALGTWVLHNYATELESGIEVEIHGRHKHVQLFFLKIAEILGTTGVLILGAALAVLLIIFTVIQWRRREPQTIWQ